MDCKTFLNKSRENSLQHTKENEKEFVPTPRRNPAKHPSLFVPSNKQPGFDMVLAQAPGQATQHLTWDNVYK